MSPFRDDLGVGKLAIEFCYTLTNKLEISSNQSPINLLGSSTERGFCPIKPYFKEPSITKLQYDQSDSSGVQRRFHG